jgi:hypothetical protein
MQTKLQICRSNTPTPRSNAPDLRQDMLCQYGLRCLLSSAFPCPSLRSIFSNLRLLGGCEHGLLVGRIGEFDLFLELGEFILDLVLVLIRHLVCEQFADFLYTRNMSVKGRGEGPAHRTSWYARASSFSPSSFSTFSMPPISRWISLSTAVPCCNPKTTSFCTSANSTSLVSCSSCASWASVFAISPSWYFLRRSASFALSMSPLARHCLAMAFSRSVRTVMRF